jgi:aspartyl/asparaginyl-tRNA synthetase
VRLSGWVYRVRDHGQLLFIDLRDHYGVTQVVIDKDSEAFQLVQSLRLESVIRVDGVVLAAAIASIPTWLQERSKSEHRPLRCYRRLRNYRCRWRELPSTQKRFV